MQKKKNHSTARCHLNGFLSHEIFNEENSLLGELMVSPCFSLGPVLSTLISCFQQERAPSPLRPFATSQLPNFPRFAQLPLRSFAAIRYDNFIYARCFHRLTRLIIYNNIYIST